MARAGNVTGLNLSKGWKWHMGDFIGLIEQRGCKWCRFKVCTWGDLRWDRRAHQFARLKLLPPSSTPQNGGLQTYTEDHVSSLRKFNRKSTGRISSLWSSRTYIPLQDFQELQGAMNFCDPQKYSPQTVKVGLDFGPTVGVGDGKGLIVPKLEVGCTTSMVNIKWRISFEKLIKRTGPVVTGWRAEMYQFSSDVANVPGGAVHARAAYSTGAGARD